MLRAPRCAALHLAKHPTVQLTAASWESRRSWRCAHAGRAPFVFWALGIRRPADEPACPTTTDRWARFAAALLLLVEAFDPIEGFRAEMKEELLTALRECMQVFSKSTNRSIASLLCCTKY